MPSFTMKTLLLKSHYIILLMFLTAMIISSCKSGETIVARSATLKDDCLRNTIRQMIDFYDQKVCEGELKYYYLSDDYMYHDMHLDSKNLNQISFLQGYPKDTILVDTIAGKYIFISKDLKNIVTVNSQIKTFRTSLSNEEYIEKESKEFSYGWYGMSWTFTSKRKYRILSMSGPLNEYDWEKFATDQDCIDLPQIYEIENIEEDSSDDE